MDVDIAMLEWGKFTATTTRYKISDTLKSRNAFFKCETLNVLYAQSMIRIIGWDLEIPAAAKR